MVRHIVTGAFSFSGRFIAQELLARGISVGTLCRRQDDPSPLRPRVDVYPFNFDQPEALVRSLKGAEVLHNTYWVRFNRAENGFDRAIANTRVLLQAAKRAGVRKIVHLSVSNPSLESPLDYYRGKAIVENDVMNCGLEYAILRPTLIFGTGDLLLNNIAYFLRRFPMFLVAGDGAYRVQPVAGQDVATLAADAGLKGSNQVLTAAGPDIFRFDELVKMIAKAVKGRARLAHAPMAMMVAASAVLGRIVGDVVLTRQEIEGLMANCLVSPDPPTAARRFPDWLESVKDTLGQEYRSEIRRNFQDEQLHASARTP